MNDHQFANMLLLTLLLLLVLHDSLGYPNGAPDTNKVCRSLTPHHSRAHPQKTPPPYSLVLEKTKIPRGTGVNITITSKRAFSYKGFMLQARSLTAHHKPAGTFTIVDPTHSQTINCFGILNSTVTHTSPVLKNTTTFVWTPSASFEGQVNFHSTIVKDYRIFWCNVSAKLYVGDSQEDKLNNLDVVQQLTAGSSAEEEYYDTGLDHRTVYDECGVTKVCLGVPDDCVATRTCEAMVTVITRKSQYEFEMLGSSYVAISLSEDGHLNVDSVTECVMTDDAIVRVYLSRYAPSTGYLRHPPGNDLKLINSSYWNGMVYCKFARNAEVHLNGVHFDFMRKKYFIFLTSHHSLEEITDVKLDNVKFHASEQNNYLSNVSGFSLSSEPKCSFSNYQGVGRSIFDFVYSTFRFFLKII